MGCTQSKIENEEAVTRCKDRKQFMKEAVSSRNAFAAAHSSYSMSLKNTGAALSDYAYGEVQNPNQSIAAISSSSSTSTSAIPQSSAATQQPSFVDTLPPPPPPPSLNTSYTPAPLQRAASMPEIKTPPKPTTTTTATIIEEEDGYVEEEDDMELENREKLTRKSRSHKSVSSSAATTSGGAGGGSSRGRKEEDEGPPPPLVEVEQPHQVYYDYIFPSVETMPGITLEMKMEKPPTPPEEVEQVVERKALDEKPKRVEDGGDSVGGSGRGKAEETEKAVEAEKVAVAAVGRGAKKGKGVGVGEKKVMKEGVNLLQIFAELDDHFLKASESAHEVSKMLEAKRLHYHSNFADNRGHIDHSARVMRVITWNRSFKGIPNVDDGKGDFDSEENETHATVLDKLLAWEKKLYDEVKAGEVMKFEYQRKVASLNKLKKRSSNSESLERAKATVGHLHTRYIVDMQSMDSTVSEINRLRDQQLYPKLVQLVDGMATMWETMRVHHEHKSKIVTALRSLDISQSPKETSERHHERTIQLLAVVQEWHTQFCRLIDYQKEYIKSLNNWLKLNLIPIESSLKEKVSSPLRAQSPPIQRLLFAWHDHLDKLQDEVGRNAIYSFAAVMSTIMQHQEEEMKLREKCEETRKDLACKTRQFEDWYHKYMQQRTPDDLDPDRPEDNPHKDAVTERQFHVETVKKRLEEEEDAYQRQCLHVREKSLASLKTSLPKLFRAMSDTALACSDMYSNLRSISRPQNPSENS